MERTIYYLRAWIWEDAQLAFWPERLGAAYDTMEEAEAAFDKAELTDSMPRIELWSARLNKYLCEEDNEWLRTKDTYRGL